MSRGTIISIACLSVALAAPLGAQGGKRDDRGSPVIPSSALPPPGMCRLWLKDVPASQQPAPTECAVAIRQRPPNAVVVFGESAPARGVRELAPGWRARKFAEPVSAVKGRANATPPAAGAEGKGPAPKPEKPQ